jgi:cell division septation protein DedD
LSCADDEATGAEPVGEERTKTSAEVLEPADPPAELLATPVSTASTSSPPPASLSSEAAKTDPVQTVEQLSNKLDSIEKKLGLILGKDDVIKKSIVDLESKLNKLEKQIVQLQAVPLERFEALEKEVAKSILPSTSRPAGNLETSETTPQSRGNIQTLKSLSGTLSPQSFSDDEQSFPDEEASFAREDTDDFSTGFQTSDTTFDKNAPQSQQKTQKRKIPILIPLLALAMIVVWLLFYYSRPKQPMQTEIVTEQVTPQTPVQTTPTLNEQRAPKPDPAKELPRDTAEKSDNLSGAAEKTLTAPQIPPPATKKSPEKGPLFTVNVGSFKDKNLATALTTQLRESGYTALMSQSEQNDFFRVRVGAFATIEEARTFASSLQKKEKLPTFVTRLEQP